VKLHTCAPQAFITKKEMKDGYVHADGEVFSSRTEGHR
jgi:hypothetical protein